MARAENAIAAANKTPSPAPIAIPANRAGGAFKRFMALRLRNSGAARNRPKGRSPPARTAPSADAGARPAFQDVHMTTTHAQPLRSQPVLYAEGLTKRYGSRPALTDCDLTIPRGRVIGLVGPNGAGK